MTVGGLEWPPPRDPGRQPERTRLSWRRTMLTVTVVALLTVRLAFQPSVDTALTVFTVAAVLTGWLAMLTLSGRRITAMVAVEPTPIGRTVLLVTLATIGFAGLGVLLIAAP